MRIETAGHTDTGKLRGHNEDAILVRDDLGLWAVADGLGGHSAGDYASSLVVERLGALTRPTDVSDFLDTIDDCINEVNSHLRQHARERGVDLIGSTLVLLIAAGDCMLCGWVGDSRAYCFEDADLRQITSDHVHGGGDDAVTRFASTASTPPKAGAEALTRAIGAEDTVHLDWVVAASQPGVRYLLCSDGINKEISDAELAHEFGQKQAAGKLLEALFKLAGSRAARDNMSAVVVRLC